MDIVDGVSVLQDVGGVSHGRRRFVRENRDSRNRRTTRNIIGDLIGNRRGISGSAPTPCRVVHWQRIGQRTICGQRRRTTRIRCVTWVEDGSPTTSSGSWHTDGSHLISSGSWLAAGLSPISPVSRLMADLPPTSSVSKVRAPRPRI